LKKQRSHQVNILASPKELARLKAAAAASGVTVSDLIRYLVLRHPAPPGTHVRALLALQDVADSRP
jgi:hypothetical protein